MEVNSCQNSSLKRVTPWKVVSNSYSKKKVLSIQKRQTNAENLVAVSKSLIITHKKNICVTLFLQSNYELK